MVNENFKQKGTNYIMVDNNMIDDETLSPQALYIYLKAKRYALDTGMTKAFLMSKCFYTKKTFNKYVDELLEKGYLKKINRKIYVD